MEQSTNRNGGPQKTFLVAGITITECQMRIIGLNVLGLLRKEMADALGVKPPTIDSHFNRIYKLLLLEGGRQLVVWALSNGFNANGHYNGIDLMEGFIKGSDEDIQE